MALPASDVQRFKSAFGRLGVIRAEVEKLQNSMKALENEETYSRNRLALAGAGPDDIAKLEKQAILEREKTTARRSALAKARFTKKGKKAKKAGRPKKAVAPAAK